MRNIFRLKLLFSILLFAVPALGQQVVPGYSTKRVDALVHAIGRAEGFGLAGAKPTRLRNPGDLRQYGVYRHFRTNADGWAALRAQVVRVLAGESRQYRLDMTIAQMGRRYAGSPLWAANVAKYLRVPGSTTLEEFLCNGDLDVPPQIKFSALE